MHWISIWWHKLTFFLISLLLRRYFLKPVLPKWLHVFIKSNQSTSQNPCWKPETKKQFLWSHFIPFGFSTHISGSCSSGRKIGWKISSSVLGFHHLRGESDWFANYSPPVAFSFNYVIELLCHLRRYFWGFCAAVTQMWFILPVFHSNLLDNKATQILWLVGLGEYMWAHSIVSEGFMISTTNAQLRKQL